MDAATINLMSALARASGYLSGIGQDGPVLDDDPMDFIRRLREGSKIEAEVAKTALDAWLGAQQKEPR